MDKLSTLLWAVLVLAGIVIVVVLWANRPRNVSVDAPLPVTFPETGFSHDAFEQLMQEYVSPDGGVDYERWHASPEAVSRLDSYLAAVSRYNPDSTPERFSSRNDALAYWMYAYNAWVIKGVLTNWPLKSVTDVKAPLELVKGLGFFYQLRFPFGGKYMSLYAVENDKIRKQFRDPRIHFVLNCASESCPVARPELPTGADLDALLDTAAEDFVGNANNVSVDHRRKTVYLSSIFKWYRNDFINDLHARGLPARRGLIDYVESIAPEPLRSDLRRADDYKIVFRDYDWSVNETD